jgi:CBS domain-containing protein
MLYLSQLLGAPVEDLQYARVGKVIDVMTPAAQVGQNAVSYPSALLIEGEEEQPWRVPLASLEQHESLIRLCISTEQLQRSAETPAEQDEVYLAQEVLDKQVIDVEHKKAVRVNDIYFGDDWRILGVDHSTLGLIRRLAPAWLLGNRGRGVPSALLPWSRIELIGAQHPEVQEEEKPSVTPTGSLRVPTGHLADLHPADIAEIVHQLTPGQGARIIERLDDETAADTMEEIDTDRQRHILENIQADRAADILQAMGPDEAADLLSQLPEERAQELLRLMNPEESEEVQELLEYEPDTAGGLMTTDYIVLNVDRTVADALGVVRTNISENDVRIAYIYCVEDETQDESRVLGVVSLWDLLIAVPTQQLQDLMETDVVTVKPDDDAHTVAEIMAKYNLLAVPVVNEEQVLAGVVTVDDALDVLLPSERRRKPKRMY